jgi:glycosyltransferase involved in cell wall biosynthesis
MRLVLVVDSHASALGISARQYQESDNTFILAALDYKKPRDFLSSLEQHNADVIVFVWRRILLELLSHKKSLMAMNRIKERSRIYFVIADHLGLTQRYFLEESPLFMFSHGYFTTSDKLFKHYKERIPQNIPLGLYRDQPDLNLISQVKSEVINRNAKKIVWVGNSAWGENYGFRDHKGYGSIIQPLSKILSYQYPEITFSIIDSASNRMDNLSVLREIRSSKVLLVTSKSEGTGLPILEALALGTTPLTTDVGIAHEVLSGKLAQNILSRNVDEFLRKILNVLASDVSESFLEDTFEKYLERNISSFLHAVESQERSVTTYHEFPVKKSMYIKWLLRYAKKRLS